MNSLITLLTLIALVIVGPFAFVLIGYWIGQKLETRKKKRKKNAFKLQVLRKEIVR